jgi:hypothetical protein
MTRPIRTTRPLLVVVVALLALLLGSCTADRPTPTPSSGSSSSRPDGADPGTVTPPAETVLGAKWDWSRFEQFAPYLESLRGAPTFYEAVWCELEPEQGRLDWATLDDVVAKSQDVGAVMMLKIRTGRCWVTPGEAQFERGSKGKTESAMPSDMQAYRDFVTAMVERYAARGVHRYAIENEINSQSFWGGTPEEYEELARTAAETIRAADPEAVVVDPGLSSTTYGYGAARTLLDAGDEDGAIEAWNTYYERRIGTRGDKIPQVEDVADLEEALDSEQGRRNLAYLRVVRELAEDGTTEVRQVHYYETWQAVPLLFDYLRATTPEDVPLEMWEVGRFARGQETDPAEGAAEVVQTVSLMLAEGAAVVIWLPLAYDPSGRNSDEPRLGLLEPNGASRPAGEVYEAMALAARGATPTPIETDGLLGVGFDGPQGSSAFVWSTETVDVQLAAGDTAGPVGTPGASSPSVQVGAEPKQIVLDGTVQAFLEQQG